MNGGIFINDIKKNYWEMSIEEAEQYYQDGFDVVCDADMLVVNVVPRYIRKVNINNN